MRFTKKFPDSTLGEILNSVPLKTIQLGRGVGDGSRVDVIVKESPSGSENVPVTSYENTDVPIYFR